MIETLLVDSSVWISLLRGGVPTVRDRLAESADSGTRLATCEPIALELLAGARPSALRQVEQLLDGLPLLGLDPSADFRSAAALHRRTRTDGHTVRSLMDCVIAAIALRHDAVVVHRDRDFDCLGAATGLRTQRWD